MDGWGGRCWYYGMEGEIITSGGKNTDAAAGELFLSYP